MEYLEEFNEDYEDAEVTRSDFDVIPDGTYQVFVDEVAMKETKESKKPMLSWKFKIMGGKYEGRFLFKNSVITHDTIGYVKTDLSICKLKLDKFSDLPTQLFNLFNVWLEVKVANKGDNQNVYLQKRIEPVEAKSDEQKSF